MTSISIHSLPKKGDIRLLRHKVTLQAFQSTPSPRRETKLLDELDNIADISIHSLPKKGDFVLLFHM